MRYLLVGLLSSLLVVLPRQAHAHSVPGDRDPGTSTYVLPGPLVTAGGRWCCVDRPTENGFLDLGVEVSAFHFVRDAGLTIFDQPGYGALAQLSLGGVPTSGKRNRDEIGTDLRFALGAEGTLGVLGAQAGAVTRIGSPNYGTSVGAFLGGFFSIGILSVGAQAEMPFVSSGSRRAPVLFTVPATFKWPVLEIPDRAPISSRTSS